MQDGKSRKQRKNRQVQSRPKRGKHKTWSEEAMTEAMRMCINEPKMAVRAAAKQYGSPRATLQSRVSGSVEMGAIAGRKSLLPEHLEKKLVDFADNRAKMGIGFGKEKFMDYAAKLGQKHGFKFKKSRPSNRWWQGINRRHTKKTH